MQDRSVKIDGPVVGSNINTGDQSYIQSTLNNAIQTIAESSHRDAAMKEQIQQLIAHLSAELQNVPKAYADAAKEATKRAEQAVAEAAKPKPDTGDVEYSLSRLKQAAENIAQVLPTVLPITMQITDALRRMIGA